VYASSLVCPGNRTAYWRRYRRLLQPMRADNEQPQMPSKRSSETSQTLALSLTMTMTDMVTATVTKSDSFSVCVQFVLQAVHYQPGLLRFSSCLHGKRGVVGLLSFPILQIGYPLNTDSNYAAHRRH
jgi:hypothetical protein